MLATATHDRHSAAKTAARAWAVIKRSRPSEWQAAGRAAGARRTRRLRPETIAPDDEYQLYQALVGAWPCLDLAGRTTRTRSTASANGSQAGGSSRCARPSCGLHGRPRTRLARAPISAFLEALLDPARSARFIDRLGAFVDRIGPAAAMNGLVQLVLRYTAPGMPDMYQGAEFWDFSMVDPDNRRPVDYPARIAALEAEPSWPELHENWRDGRIEAGARGGAAQPSRDRSRIVCQRRLPAADGRRHAQG